MPIYCFNAAKLADRCPDGRWTRLKDEEAARRFAKLLVEEFVASGRYADYSDWRLDVRDECRPRGKRDLRTNLPAAAA